MRARTERECKHGLPIREDASGVAQGPERPVREEATVYERERNLLPQETSYEAVLADLNGEPPGKKVSGKKRSFEAKKSDMVNAS